MRRGLLATVLMSGLGGCHLIDQTDFDPPAPSRVERPIPAPESRTALLTIEYGKPNPDYKTVLAGAIKTVEARRPGALYDVVAVVGDAGQAVTGRGRAAEVMTAVEAAGVNPARVLLGMTIEPGRTFQQVRVYLR